MVATNRGKEVKLSFLFLIGILILSMSSVLVSWNIAEASGKVNVVYKFVNVDDENKELNKLEESRDMGESIKYTPPETISVDGTDYTRIETGEISESNLSSDKEYVLEYTSKTPGAKPQHIIPAENSGEGMINLNEALWKLQDGKIATNIDFEVSGKHMATRLGSVSQTVGKDKELVETEEDTVKTENSMKKSDTFKDEFTDSNVFERGTDGVYRVKISYWYTNLASGNFECVLGVDERCFEWALVEDEPYTPYWGGFNETIEIDDEQYRTTNIYELEIEMELDDVSNKDYTLEELPESLPIGKGVLDKKNVITGKIDNNSSLLTQYFERFNIKPKTGFELGTQQAVDVTEYIGYENDFGGTLEVSGNPTYYIGHIDENLKNQLEYDEELGSKVNLIYNEATQSFEMGKVFGLSNTYGIQFIADKTDLILGTSTEDMEESLNKELQNLNLGTDSLVNLDYLKSRYFLPIDDVKYQEEDIQYKDTVVLDGIGLNNLSLRYDKLFTVKEDLVSDEDTAKFKGYEQELEVKEDIEYLESEELSEEELKSYLEAYETSSKVNVFRDTDDRVLDAHIKERDKE